MIDTKILLVIILCIIAIILIVIIKQNAKQKEVEGFNAEQGKLHAGGKGGMLISPLGLPFMFDNQIVKPVSDPIDSNAYNRDLPNNIVNPTIFYRYYYLEKYYLSILYQMFQKIESEYPSKLIDSLAENKISVEQMDLIDDINSSENKMWKNTIEYVLKYIYEKYPHIDIPFTYNKTTVYKYIIPQDLETYDGEQLYLIQFQIRKNFHYLLAIEPNATPEILTLYIKFTYNNLMNEPKLVLARIKEIYNAYVEDYKAVNSQDYVQFVDEPEQHMEMSEEEINKKVNEHYKFIVQTKSASCKRKHPATGKMTDEIINVTNEIDCIIEDGVWDAPCVKNTDCPFYKANKNYPNEFGGCNNDGRCELPVGLSPIGYRMYDDIKNAETYNCANGYYGEGTIGKCAIEQTDQIRKSKEMEKAQKSQIQIDKTINGGMNGEIKEGMHSDTSYKLKTPDYVFMGDTLIRKNFSDLLLENNLNWTDY